jgi:rubrerythrin
MNIFDFALKMEADAEQYYLQLTAKAAHPELKVVLQGLAEDEQRHYKIVQRLQQQEREYIEPDPIISATRNVFSLAGNEPFIPKNQESIAKWKDEQRDVYQAALHKEEASVHLYKKLRDTVESPAEKDILEKLVQEEERHAEVLGNIMQMLNNFNEWVESAEFHHQKPY